MIKAPNESDHLAQCYVSVEYLDMYADYEYT